MSKKAIVIFGGGLSKGKGGTWHTTRFDEKGDQSGVLGDRLRVLAGKAMYDKNRNQQIIVLGGSGQLADVKGAPTVSEVIKRELMELGVPAGKIFTETFSKNTYTQLIELKKILGLERYDKIVIISNDYHLPRIKIMMEKDEFFAERLGGNSFKLVSSEKILLKHNPKKWSGVIKNAYESRGMRNRIKREEKGVRMLKEGKYKSD